MGALWGEVVTLLAGVLEGAPTAFGGSRRPSVSWCGGAWSRRRWWQSLVCARGRVGEVENAGGSGWSGRRGGWCHVHGIAPWVMMAGDGRVCYREGQRAPRQLVPGWTAALRGEGGWKRGERGLGFGAGRWAAWTMGPSLRRRLGCLWPPRSGVWRRHTAIRKGRRLRLGLRKWGPGHVCCDGGPRAGLPECKVCRAASTLQLSVCEGRASATHANVRALERWWRARLCYTGSAVRRTAVRRSEPAACHDLPFVATPRYGCR